MPFVFDINISDACLVVRLILKLLLPIIMERTTIVEINNCTSRVKYFKDNSLY